jgi:hypothetical protein
MIAGLILATALVGPPAPADLTDCSRAVAAVAEARRVRRDVLLYGSAMAASHLSDVAATAWAKARFGCRNTPAGQPCLVEENQAFPLTVGLIAGKGVYVLGGTVAAYELDKRGHRAWARVITAVVSAAGLVPAAVDVVRGAQVHRARAR